MYHKKQIFAIAVIIKAVGKNYEDTDLISVSEEGILTFNEEIVEGIYRIKLMVKDGEGNVIVETVQNIAILERVSV